MQTKELNRAKESYAKLQMSMEITQKRQKDHEENFKMEADEAKLTLVNMEKTIKKKQD